jgi:acyl carrier protein
MDPSAAEIDAARWLVANALSVQIDLIGSESQMYDIPIWDSLGQLSLILMIEETLGIQVSDESAFEKLKSVRGVAAYVSGHTRHSMNRARI